MDNVIKAVSDFCDKLIEEIRIAKLEIIELKQRLAKYEKP